MSDDHIRKETTENSSKGMGKKACKKVFTHLSFDNAENQVLTRTENALCPHFYSPLVLGQKVRGKLFEYNRKITLVIVGIDFAKYQGINIADYN